MSTQTIPEAPPVSERPPKILYIDHLRVLVIILVVLHHTLITYGAPGDWYYSQKTTVAGAIIPMTLLVTINQAFFMGFFFFLSAYFIPISYEKKGASRFVTDRLERLGIPLIFYSFILSPILNYLVYYFGQGNHISFLRYLRGYDDWIDFGVLWFVAALLLFTLAYVLWQRFFATKGEPKAFPAPSFGLILQIGLAVGILSFLARTIFPVGWVLKPLGFQLGYFSQYLVLFVLGTSASKRNWLNQIPVPSGKKFARYPARLLLFLPVFYILEKTFHLPQNSFTGGWHPQQLLFAVWEQVLGLSIIIALLCIGKEKWNGPSMLLAKLSRSAFAVYIFHPLVVVSLALVFRNWGVDPAVKLLVVAPLAVSGSFLLGAGIVLIPGVKKII